MNKCYKEQDNFSACAILQHVEKDLFLWKGVFHVCKGQLLQQVVNATVPEFNVAYCCNYVIVQGEPFVRIDAHLTHVSDAEQDTGTEHVNSTRIDSGHKHMSVDVQVAACAGEIRLKRCAAKNDQEVVVQVVSCNLQTSYYAFPENDALQAWQAHGIDGLAKYRTNYWEKKGRLERFKYLNKQDK